MEIIGNASSLTHALGQSSNSARSFGHVLGTVVKAGAVAMGAGLVIAGVELHKAIGAAEDAQVSQAKLATAFKATGVAMKAHARQIDELTAVGRKLGFSDAEQRDALGSLIVATHNYGMAAKDLAVAEDIARFKHVALADASKMLSMAMTGSQRAAKQLGITVIPLTTNVDKLKAAHVNLTTEQGKAELAAAKLADKQATGAAVIDKVRDAVKGQAEAFSGTGAGAIARYHAEMEHLQATIGDAFLPILDKVVTKMSEWIDRLNQAPRFHQALAAASTGLSAAFSGLGTAISAASQFIRAHWTEIQAAALQLKNTVMTVVEAMIAIWQRFGPTITRVAQIAFDTIVPMIRGALQVIRGIFEIITALMHGDWSKAWQGIKDVARGALTYLGALLRGYISILGATAGQLGLAIVNGIWNKLQELGAKVTSGLQAGVVAPIQNLISNAWNWGARVASMFIGGIVSGIMAGVDKVKGAFHAVSGFLRNPLGSGTAETWPREWVPKYIDAIARELVAGGAKVAAAHKQATAALRVAGPELEIAAGVIGRSAIKGIIDGIVGATPSLGQQLKTALSQAVAQALDAAKQAALDAKSAFETAFGNLASAALAAFDAKVAAWKSPAQKMLDAMQLEDQMKQLQAAIDQANAQASAAQSQADAAAAQMATATASGDPAAIAAATAAVAAAGQAVLDAQKAQADAERAQLEFTLAQKAAAEQAAHDKLMAKRRMQLEAQLAQLQTWLEKHPKEYEKMHGKILALFARFDLDYKRWGAKFGDAIAKGLHEAQGSVEAAAKALAQAVAAYVKLGSPAKKGPLSTLDEWWAPFSKTLMRGADMSALAMPSVGGYGGGTMTPSFAGGGASGGTVINVYGDLIDGEKLANIVQGKLLRKQQRGVALGLK